MLSSWLAPLARLLASLYPIQLETHFGRDADPSISVSSDIYYGIDQIVQMLLGYVGGIVMSHIAKLFTNGRSQAVRLPAAYRFDTSEVYIRKDPETGDVILSRRPNDWESFLRIIKDADVPADFLIEQERQQDAVSRTPFQDWQE
jgi:antitoxin VapB